MKSILENLDVPRLPFCHFRRPVRLEPPKYFRITNRGSFPQITQVCNKKSIQKSTPSQCGNFRIFLSFRFYVKSKLENLTSQSSEIAVLPFCGFEFCYFYLQKVQKVIKNQNSEPLKAQNWQMLTFPIQINFYVKSE